MNGEPEGDVEQVERKQLRDVPRSVLDLAPIQAGRTPAEAFRRSLDLARHAERWGYTRYWVAEHHNMAGIASAATSVVMGYIAAGTATIRVGSGGVMLPNHAPLIIAEQFGTLESLYPGRIDLGLGRAPGTDPMTARALRRDGPTRAWDFPEMLEELRGYFGPAGDGRNFTPVRSIPSQGVTVPIWLLGSSDFSAQLAGYLGLPFAFAGQFAAENTQLALNAYRQSFQPSEVLQQPYAMVGVNVVAADTDEEADFLSTTQQQKFLQMIRGRIQTAQMVPPVNTMEGLWEEHEKEAVLSRLASSIVGGPDRVRERLLQFLDSTAADEVIINAEIFHHADRLHSYEIVAEVWPQ